ncbi:hypothetical protein [Bacillus cereus group sp. N34]|nr:hypothetical protein [Bacillus cereus group sp. N34]
MKKKKEITIISISYVHDPEAANRWFEAYIEIIKKELTKAVEKD